MIKEIFCVVVVLFSIIVPSDKIRAKVCNLVENTFTILEIGEGKIKSQAVKVFGNSTTLKSIIRNDSY